MLSSQNLAQNIVNDLDQNAYTSWHDQTKILRGINSACSFLLAYWKRPWSLEIMKSEKDPATDEFTFDNDIFYPYRANLDWVKLKRNNIPIVWLDDEESRSFHVLGNVVKTKESWKVLQVLAHRWRKRLNSLWTNDIAMPSTMFQPLTHLALWFIYPSWLELWSSLANQHYNMAITLLDTYAKAYWFNLQPSQVEAAAIYTRI